MGDRTVRISSEIKREIGHIIKNELKDPRIPELVSVVSCRVAGDLSVCEVGVSVYGDEGSSEAAMEGLRNAAGYVRRLLGERVRIRHVPEVVFKRDDSIKRSARISMILREAGALGLGQGGGEGDGREGPKVGA
ncbi:MAG: 30S ribosome-binding factor RbfA [Oscillospiraceae bacterium]|nr:30S ribosome-binding factor RbfA [Oscillospiraceae bacterium]